MKKETVASLLGNGYWIVNKRLHYKLKSAACTIFLSDLMDKYLYFKNKKQLDKDGGFFNTFEDRYFDTLIPQHMQRKYTNHLKSLGLLKTKLKLSPAKNHYYIQFDTIINYIEFDGTDDEWKRVDGVKKLIKECTKSTRKSYDMTVRNAKKTSKKGKSELNQSQFQNSSRVNSRIHPESIPYNNDTKSNETQSNDIFINKNDNDFSDANASSKIDDNKNSNYKEAAKRSRKRLQDQLPKKPNPKSRKRTRQSRSQRNADAIIKTWNDIPTTTTHRIDPNNQTYQKIKRDLTAMMDGKFGSSRHWDKDWRKTIPDEYFKNKKWTALELEDAIINLSCYTKAGYWPSKGKSSFKSLLTGIYNERTSKSMLLQAHAHPPRPISQSDDKPSKNPEMAIWQEVMLEYIGHDKTVRMKSLEKCIYGIQKYFDKQSKKNNEFAMQRGPFVLFLRFYGDWLEENWPTADPARIAPGSAPFKQFESWMYDEDYLS